MSYLRSGLLLGFLAVLISPLAFADTLYHQNGQVINGTIVEESNTHITIQSDDYGRLRFERKVIDRLMRGGVEVSPSDLSQVPPAPETDGAAPAPATATGGSPFAESGMTGQVPPPPPVAPAGSASPFAVAGSGAGDGANTFGAPPQAPPPASTSSSPFSEPTAPAAAAPAVSTSTNPFTSAPDASSSPFAEVAPGAGSPEPSAPAPAPITAVSSSPFAEIAPASGSPFANIVTTNETSQPMSSTPSANGNSAPFSAIGGESSESSAASPSFGDTPPAESVSLPPAFQLASASATPADAAIGGNPLSVSNSAEPVIFNSGQDLQPTRITRNNHAPREVPAGGDAVIYGIVNDVRIHVEDNGWQVPQNNSPLTAGVEIWTSNGKAKILLNNQSHIYIPPDTNVVLDRTDSVPPSMFVELKSGHFWLQVPSSVASFPVETSDIKATLQPGLYTIGLETGLYTRLAVFEGGAEGVNIASNQPFTLGPNQAIMGSGDIGTLCPPRQCTAEERREYDEWDMWAYEVHKQMAQKHMFKGPDPELAKGTGDIQPIAQSKLSPVTETEDLLTDIKGAFLQFCIDTGQAPTSNSGFSALVRNPGMSGWRGPYYKGPIPPVDKWGMPIRYSLKRDTGTGQVVGEILSAGPNRIYSEGRSDDIMAVVPFHRHIR